MIQSFVYESVYSDGYNRALQDVQDWIDFHSEILKNCRLFNHKGIHNLLNTMIKHSDKMRELGRDIEFFMANDKKEIKLAR